MDSQVAQIGLKFLTFLSLIGMHHHTWILTGN